jgi:hypothetical protein
MVSVKRLALRILPRDMPEDPAVGARRAVQDHREMRDSQRWRGRDEIDKGILIHEVMEKLEIFHEMRLGNVQGRIDARMLLFPPTATADCKACQHFSSVDSHPLFHGPGN